MNPIWTNLSIYYKDNSDQNIVGEVILEKRGVE